MAEGIFHKLLRERGLEHQITVDSAGTGGWHTGQGADRRTVRVLEHHGAGFDHVARQVQDSDASFDLILVADRANLRDLEPWPEVQRKAKLLLEDLEIPDPYYGDLDDFEKVYAMLEPAIKALLDGLEKV
jgi:protein-tyrosine phosphatase